MLHALMLILFYSFVGDISRARVGAEPRNMANQCANAVAAARVGLWLCGAGGVIATGTGHRRAGAPPGAV